ncbi:TonB-dependent receptor [Kinneretia aquatilis]|uniref:TonB-dependent receptor n=1 Tax=Kinneretia aquatilis TaxID=2070761 RepID=UPI0014952BB3|nr:TonB-dependent receptor [Paucibacter aquatile]WIV99271.1 TonB-dependent receptor [Paucibacter aquatile]
MKTILQGRLGARQLSLLGAAALSSCAALAQASPNTADVAAPLLNSLGTVQVRGQAQKSLLQTPQSTASRLGLSPLETAASIEVLEVDRLRARGDASVAELVSRSTGLAAQGSPGSGSTYSSRGFSGNDSVAQAEDGLRMATASGTQSSPGDSFGYERIEILRGPASVLFGDGAIGGLINLVRKSPGREARSELTAGLGTDGEYRLGLGLGRPLGEQLGLRLDALAKGGDGFVARGQHRNRKLMSLLRWQATPDLRLDLSLDIHRDSPTAYFGSPLKNGQLWAELRGENYNISDAIWRMDQERARARLDWQLAEGLAARVVAYRFEADRRWQNLEEYALSPDAQTVQRSGYLGIAHELRQNGLRAELLGQGGQGGPGARLNWSLGAERMDLRFQHANDLYDTKTVSSVPLHGFDPGHYIAAAELLPRNRSQTEQLAVFAEADWQPLDGWHLSAGLRRDRSVVDRQILSPKPDAWSGRFTPTAWRLGTVWQLSPAQSLYGQLSSGTDPVGTIATLSKANAALRLTEGRQAEVGFKQAGAVLEWTVALFQIAKTHILTPDPKNPRESVQGGRLRSRGLELGLAWTPAPGWRLDANASLLRARYTELFDSAGLSLAGKRAPNVAERLANLWLSRQQGEFDLGAGLRHVGQRYTNTANTQSLPGYTVLDASLGWRFSRQGALRLQLRNLGDRLYASSTYTASQAMLGKPRSADLVLDYRFD